MKPRAWMYRPGSSSDSESGERGGDRTGQDRVKNYSPCLNRPYIKKVRETFSTDVRKGPIFKRLPDDSLGQAKESERACQTNVTITLTLKPVRHWRRGPHTCLWHTY